MELKRYTLNDVSANLFYQMPKFLFQGELKNKLSNDAKVLYSLLKDRHELSIKNNWVNEKNEVYLIMTRDEMCSLLGISIKPVIKAVNQLKEIGLMQEIRQGLNKPNLLFLLNYSEVKSWTCQNDNSGTVKTTTQDLSKEQLKSCQNDNSKNVDIPTLNLSNRHTNNTNISNTDFIKTNNHQIIKHEADEEDVETLAEVIKDNIGYDVAKATPGESDYIDNILNIMIEVICSKAPTVRVGKEEKPQAVVKSLFMKLTYDHISYVCLCLKENTNPIKYIKPYIITTLYNAPQTMDIYYSQRVQFEIIGG